MTFLEIRMRDDQACLSASVCICCLFCSAFLLPLFDCEKDKHRCIKAASVSLSWLTSLSLSLFPSKSEASEVLSRGSLVLRLRSLVLASQSVGEGGEWSHRRQALGIQISFTGGWCRARDARRVSQEKAKGKVGRVSAPSGHLLI